MLFVSLIAAVFSCSDGPGFRDIIKGGSLLPHTCQFNEGHYNPDQELLGRGTEEYPYHICYPEQMNLISDTDVNENYALDKHYGLFWDIDFKNQQPLTPIAGTFTGAFHGNGFTIRNLTIRPAAGEAGLFLELGTNGIIKDLRLEEVNITGSGRVGALAAVSAGRIDSIHVTGNIKGSIDNDILGGLVGLQSGGVISSSSTQASIDGGKGSDYVGGLVGVRSGGAISGSQALGSVMVMDDEYIEGLVGSQGSPQIAAAFNDTSAVIYFAGRSGSNWTVSSDSADWCTPPSSIAGMGLIQSVDITLEENMTGSPRACTITFNLTTAGGISQSFRIAQKSSYLDVTDIPEYVPGYIPGSDLITDLTTNTGLAWTVSSDSTTWCGHSINSGTGTDSAQAIAIILRVNGGSSNRSCALTFTAGGVTRTFTVTQRTVITLAESSATIDTAGGNVVVDLTTNIGLDWTVSSDSTSWCSPNTVSGTGTDSAQAITITLQASRASSNRSCTITFEAGGISRKFTITQGWRAHLTLSRSRTTADALLRNVIVDLNTNTGLDWTVSSDSTSWCSPNTVSGTGTDSAQAITITIQANTTSSNRSCTITFEAGGISRKFIITQERAYLTLSRSGITSDHLLKNIMVYLTTNTGLDWTVSSNSTSWCSPRTASGTGTDSPQAITITIQASRASSNRSCTITFEAGGVSQTFIITQLWRAYMTFRVSEVSPAATVTSSSEATEDVVSINNFPRSGGTFKIILNTNQGSTVSYTVSGRCTVDRDDDGDSFEATGSDQEIDITIYSSSGGTCIIIFRSIVRDLDRNTLRVTVTQRNS